MAGVTADLSVLYRKKQNVGQCTRRDHYTGVTHRCPRTDISLPGPLCMRISALQMWTWVLTIFGYRFKTRGHGVAIQVLVTYRLSASFWNDEMRQTGPQRVILAEPCLL
jgi:hypothetical protein